MQVEYSPDSQIRLIRDYAKYNGYLIPDEFVFMELGVSGKSADKRPEFQKMIELAKSRKFESILIYHTNRFARNHEESILYKSMLKRDCNIDVISITQPPIDHKTDMLTNAIYSVMDEWYSIDLAANVKRGMTEKAMRGKYQCSPPYGYKIPGLKQTPIVVEDEAKVVRKIFSMYLNETTSIWNIAKRLSAMGYRTRRGNRWERRTVEYILRNPAYKGMAVWNKRNNNQKLNDPSDWIVVQGTHDAIISPEDFDKAQDIYNTNKAPKRKRPSGTYAHWLSGILRCATCGRVLTFSGSQYGSFGCNGYKKGTCPSKGNSISRLKAEKAVIDMLREISEEVIPISLTQIVIPVSDNQKQIDALNEQITRLENMIAKFKDAYSAGYDTLEEYGQNKAMAIQEIDLSKSQITELEAPPRVENAVQNVVLNVKFVYEMLCDKALNMEEKNRAMHVLISRIVYDKESETFDLYYNYTLSS